MAENMDIREASRDDHPGINRLFRTCFGRDLSRQEWVWKYRTAPWGSFATVAVERGEVVAHYGGIRMKMISGGRTFDAYQFCDVMTHPAYRSRMSGKSPVIVLLGELFYKERQMDFAFGFPSPRHARLQGLRLGGQGYRHVRLYKKEDFKSRRETRRLRVREGWGFFSDRDADRCSAGDPRSLRIVKDDTYVRWRYVEHPHGQYRVLVFDRLFTRRGSVIFTVRDNRLNVLDIALRHERDFEAVMVSLEHYVADRMAPICAIEAWFHPSEAFAERLEYLGYHHEDSIPVAFRPVNLASGIDAEGFYEKYYYRMGDYDAS